MNTLQLTIQDKLAIITLDRGRSNPMNIEMLTELMTAVNDIEADDKIGGLIITGKENFFSSGVDLIEVFNYNEEQSEDFWTKFLQLQTVLVNFKKPFVAAITGHSPAGGCIIALCSDYRVMATGPFIIGLNEIPVGIVVPDAVFHLYSFWIGKRKAYQYLLEGKLLNAEEAFKDGLVDELCAPEDVLLYAEKKIHSYMKLNPATWSQSKLNLRKELSAKMVSSEESLNIMLKQWWAPETRLTLQKVVEKLMNPVKK
jgi:3,2-trans-enoyl-CoA isomerase